MYVELPYGATETIGATIDWARPLGTLDVANAPALARPAEAFIEALERPIGQPEPLAARLKPGESVAIVVSDAFRKTAIDQLLPALLEQLEQAGVRSGDIVFVFATGTHRAPTPSEQAQILGPAVYERFKDQAFPHDPQDRSNLVHVGTTSRGTPVIINKRVLDCDRIIVTGAVVMHYFGGFGGGRKAVLPGIASVQSISHNHAMNLDPVSDRLDPRVRIAGLEGNPVAEDMLEGACMVPVDLLINTVLNRDGRIAGIFVGDLEAAHLKAAEFAYSLYAVDVGQSADLVVASSGGTKNFVQTHKALFNAYQAMRPGGYIVLAAKCEEGLGGENFVKWLRLGSREAIIAGLRQQSEINGQTALSTIEKAPRAFLVTDMSENDVAQLGAQKARSLDEALERVRTGLAEQGCHEPSCYVMPSAAYTVPFLPAPAELC